MTKPILILAPLFMAIFFSCTKEQPEAPLPEEEKVDTYGYEVTCESCNISFVDETQSTKSVFNQSGKVTIDFKLAIYHELEVNVTLGTNNVKLAKAAILKNGEPIQSYQSYSSFRLTPSGGTSTANPGSSPSTPNNPSSPSTPTNPSSSLCGAPTKSGGYCKRKVSGGGRCWQHR